MSKKTMNPKDVEDFLILNPDFLLDNSHILNLLNNLWAYSSDGQSIRLISVRSVVQFYLGPFSKLKYVRSLAYLYIYALNFSYL